MNIYRQLNLLFDYIEAHLYEEININKLSHFIGTSESNFKIFFSLFVGCSISEYIRNRRLSECVSLLTKTKIIDIAILCGYESRASFSRAFKAFHGFNPSKYKDYKKFNYISRLNFDEEPERKTLYKASYKIINAMTVFGIDYVCRDVSDIPVFWRDVSKQYPTINLIDKKFGLVYKDKTSGKIRYCICLETSFDSNNKTFYIPSGNYLSIIFNNADNKKISSLGKSIKSKNMDEYPNIEIYSANCVELLFKVFD